MTQHSHSHYIHGSSPGEQERLSALNELINSSSFREMDPQPGSRVLDVGCGLGQFTRMIARATGTCVVGIERDADQIARCRRLAAGAGEEDLMEVRQGDVEAFPLSDGEWETFDIVHARFILEHVPDPQRVVDAMVRAARPGGRIILEDDDHDLLRLWPESPAVQGLWDAYQRTFPLLGNDPAVGRKLPALLHAAGAELRRATWIFFGASAGEATFPVYVENLAGILNGAREQMVTEGLTSAGAFEEGIHALQAWKLRPDAAFWYGRSWAEGVKPQSSINRT